MRIRGVVFLLFILIPLLATIGFGKERITFSLGEEITAPKIIRNSFPPYTEEARKAGINGALLRLEAVITTTGRVRDIEIINGLEYGLDESAVETLTKYWFFEPATFKGQPVEVKMFVELCFRLDEAYTEKPVDVDNVEFVGNSVFTGDQLKATIQKKLKALSDTLQKNLINDYIIEAIGELYKSHGYIKAYIRCRPDNVVHIQEGKQFRVSRLEILGSTAFEKDELLALFGLRKGDIVDIPRIRTALRRIEEMYVSIGLPNFSYVSTQTLDEQEAELDIVFEFQER